MGWHGLRVDLIFLTPKKYWTKARKKKFRTKKKIQNSFLWKICLFATRIDERPCWPLEGNNKQRILTNLTDLHLMSKQKLKTLICFNEGFNCRLLVSQIRWCIKGTVKAACCNHWFWFAVFYEISISQWKALINFTSKLGWVIF